MSSMNDFMLIRLMGRTGVVLNSLSPWVQDKVIIRLAKILEQKDFVEFLIPWLAMLPDQKIVLNNVETLLKVKEAIFSVLEWVKSDNVHAKSIDNM